MVETILAGLVMGLFGSFHCVGMCGPLALSLPLSASGKWARIASALCYSLGRATTYFFIGLVLGWTGSRLVMVAYQQTFSISVGVIILFFLIMQKYKPQIKLFAAAQVKLKRSIAGFLTRKNGIGRIYIFGLLNGLLPCGLVFTAIASALIIGKPLDAGFFMVFFGLGTLPLMTALILSGHFISVSIRSKMRRLVPVFVGVIALLMILRGMNLGIPYVSPAFSTQKNATHCLPVNTTTR